MTPLPTSLHWKCPVSGWVYSKEELVRKTEVKVHP